MLFSSTIAFADPKPHLSFTITNKIQSNKPVLHVKLTFPADPSGENVLYYPNEFWGQENMSSAISDISSVGNTVTVKKTDSEYLITITQPAASKTVTVEYIITQDFTDSIANELYYRPIIQPTYFHVFGNCLFVMPKQMVESDKKLKVSIKWEGFPSSYNIHNSFGSGKRKQMIEETSERFLNAIFTGGDFRVYRSSIKGKPFYFAIRGSWLNATDAALNNLLQKTVLAQRNFWNDHTTDYFTVTLIPTFADDKSLSLGGEGLTNSFSCYFSNNKRFDTGLRTAHLFNHELMHHWIGHTILTQEREKHYWFREGFTDYFAYKNMLDAGIITADTWLNETNDFIIKTLYNFPVREMPNDSITKKNFWKNPDYQKLPYKRGYLFALFLDMKIKTTSDYKYSLTNVMQDILTYCVKTGNKFTDSLFITSVDKYLPESIEKDFEKYITKGNLINFSTASIDRNLVLKMKDGMPVFEMIKNSQAQK